MFKNQDIKLVKVPRIPELSAKKLTQDANKDLDLRLYLPDLYDEEKKTLRHINR
jgi:hypothetical protein